MSFASQGTQQRFPFPYDDVFQGLLEVIPHIGMKLKSHDAVIGRITASTKMSLFSYGENVTIGVEPLGDSATMLSLESSLKVGMNAAGAHRHSKNFDQIIETLSQYLQRYSSQARLDQS